MSSRAVAELDMVNRFFHQWCHHPSWPEIRSAMENNDYYCHNILTLASSSWLLDLGNLCNLYRDHHEGVRSSDLRIQLMPSSHLAVEVKAPQTLQFRTRDLQDEEARNILRDTVKKAGVGNLGQLSNQHDGILIVGGMHLSDRDIDLLNNISTDAIFCQAHKREHIVGVMFISVATSARPSLVYGGILCGGEIKISALIIHSTLGKSKL